MRRLIWLAMFLAACGGQPPSGKKSEAAPAAAEPYVPGPDAGSLSGKIIFAGKKTPPRRIDMEADEDCQKAHKSPVFSEDVLTGKGGGLANVFVYIKEGLEGKSFGPPKLAVAMDQKGCLFRPRVVGLQTGQMLEISNSDPVTHNVHPQPRVNRGWNLGQPPGAPPAQRQFSLPEIMIPIKCNVHAWMRSYAGVLPHPFFAATGADGAYQIKGIPPGGYTLEAWHEKLGAQTAKITVAPNGAATADFTFKGE